jgi:hypothetical protein
MRQNYIVHTFLVVKLRLRKAVLTLAIQVVQRIDWVFFMIPTFFVIAFIFPFGLVFTFNFYIINKV